MTVDIGGGANDEDDDCSVAAESNVWNDVMLLQIGSWKLPLVSDLVEDWSKGVDVTTVDIGGGSNDKDTDCCIAAVVWGDVTLLPCKLEGKNGSWGLLLNVASVD